MAHAFRVAGRDLTAAEWASYVPSRPHRSLGPALRDDDRGREGSPRFGAADLGGTERQVSASSRLPVWPPPTSSRGDAISGCAFGSDAPAPGGRAASCSRPLRRDRLDLVARAQRRVRLAVGHVRPRAAVLDQHGLAASLGSVPSSRSGGAAAARPRRVWPLCAAGWLHCSRKSHGGPADNHPDDDQHRHDDGDRHGDR